MQTFSTLWDNWGQMPADERAARIMAFKDAPKGLNAATKVWIDQNYPTYLEGAGAIIFDLGKGPAVITISKRSDNIHACLKDHPEIWGCGKSQYEAIGNLVAAHGDTFNTAIESA